MSGHLTGKTVRQKDIINIQNIIFIANKYFFCSCESQLKIRLLFHKWNMSQISPSWSGSLIYRIFYRSKAPTARLKLKGISIDIHIHSEHVKYIVLKKKSKTKLVLNADSPTEFDGWLTTLDIEIKRQDELQTAEKPQSDLNVDLAEQSERGRRVRTKTPVPAPRTRTPSREKLREMVTSDDSSLPANHQHDSGEVLALVRKLVFYNYFSYLGFQERNIF